MKKVILLALLVITVITFGCSSIEKEKHAVVVGPLSPPGKIVQFLDKDHIFIDMNEDSVPDIIARDRFGSYCDDIAFHRDSNWLDNIVVTTRTINGQGPYLIDYIYIKTRDGRDSVNLNMNITNVRVARKKDVLMVITNEVTERDLESSFIEKPSVRLARYQIINTRE